MNGLADSSPTKSNSGLESSGDGTSGSRAKSLLIAVAGNPNSGKTTIFNALSGLRQRVANYPGVTVERREATMAADPTIRLLDLPGLYSLNARSPDEAITREVLLGRTPGVRRPDAVLLVVDASNLERTLFAASQVIELGLPAIVVCNMADHLAAEGLSLDTEALENELGVPVVTTVASRRQGIPALIAAIRSLPGRPSNKTTRKWRLPEPLEGAVGRLSEAIALTGYAKGYSADGVALLLIDQEDAANAPSLPEEVRCALKECLASNGRAGDDQALAASQDIPVALARGRYTWLHDVAGRCVTRIRPPRSSITDRVDRVLIHPVSGNVCLALIMGAMFYGVFALASPLMDVIQAAVSATQDWISATIPAGVLHDLLRDGVVAGVGAVLSFLPQIAILFIFIAVLEDTGYIARAALLMNRLMSRVGLHGKSFIPLLSSFACAVPGILGTRTIEHSRDRLATILIAPFMSCSARLPIYTLLIAACLPMGSAAKAGVMLSMYALGIAAAASAAWLLKRTILKGEAPGFIIELPPYHIPRIKTLLLVVWEQCKQFLVKAGTVILAATIVLWGLTSYPRDASIIAQYDALRAEQAEKAETPENRPRESAVANAETNAALTADGSSLEAEFARLNQQEQAEILRHTFAGRLGRFIEPVIRPLGFNWEIGVGILASFTAREVFVGTMGIIYSVGDADESSATLQEQMRSAAWPDGRPVFTPVVALALMVFYVLSCQCVSTIAVVRQETRSWRWPLFQLAYMTGLAYVAALAVYQIGTALGY